MNAYGPECWYVRLMYIHAYSAHSQTENKDGITSRKMSVRRWSTSRRTVSSRSSTALWRQALDSPLITFIRQSVPHAIVKATRFPSPELHLTINATRRGKRDALQRDDVSETRLTEEQFSNLPKSPVREPLLLAAPSPHPRQRS